MALWKRDNTWWADVTVNGERVRQSLKTTDKREAKNLEKELVTQIQAGKVAAKAGKAYARLPFGVAGISTLKSAKSASPSARSSSRRNVSFPCEDISARRLSGESLPRISLPTKTQGSKKVSRVVRSTWKRVFFAGC